MGDESERPEVREVEVERLPEDQEREFGSGRGPGGPPFPLQPRPTMGPVLAGVLLDCVDLFTHGPSGVLIGGAAGFLLARAQGLGRSSSLIVAGLAALYCAAPLTQRMPLATLVGLYARFARPR